MLCCILPESPMTEYLFIYSLWSKSYQGWPVLVNWTHFFRLFSSFSRCYLRQRHLTLHDGLTSESAFKTWRHLYLWLYGWNVFHHGQNLQDPVPILSLTIICFMIDNVDLPHISRMNLTAFHNQKDEILFYNRTINKWSTWIFAVVVWTPSG